MKQIKLTIHPGRWNFIPEEGEPVGNYGEIVKGWSKSYSEANTETRFYRFLCFSLLLERKVKNGTP